MSEPKKPTEIPRSATERYNADGIPYRLIAAMEAAHNTRLTDGDGEEMTHAHLQQVARSTGNS